MYACMYVCTYTHRNILLVCMYMCMYMGFKFTMGKVRETRIGGILFVETSGTVSVFGLYLEFVLCFSRLSQ